MLSQKLENESLCLLTNCSDFTIRSSLCGDIVHPVHNITLGFELAELHNTCSQVESGLQCDYDFEGVWKGVAISD